MTVSEVVLVLVVIAVALTVATGIYIRDGWKRQAHDTEPLDWLFTGAPSVTYTAPDVTGGADTRVLVDAANSHGYRLASETGRRARRRVVFERRT